MTVFPRGSDSSRGESIQIFYDAIVFRQLYYVGLRLLTFGSLFSVPFLSSHALLLNIQEQCQPVNGFALNVENSGIVCNKPGLRPCRYRSRQSRQLVLPTTGLQSHSFVYGCKFHQMVSHNMR